MTTNIDQTDVSSSLQGQTVERENNTATAETSFNYKMVVSRPDDDDAIESEKASIDFRYVQQEHKSCTCFGPHGK